MMQFERYLVTNIKCSKVLNWENVNIASIEMNFNTSVLIASLKMIR